MSTLKIVTEVSLPYLSSEIQQASDCRVVTIIIIIIIIIITVISEIREKTRVTQTFLERLENKVLKCCGHVLCAGDDR
jgi:hypothetical protein